VNGCPYFRYSISTLINETIVHNSFRSIPVVPAGNFIDDADGDYVSGIVVTETTLSFTQWEEPLS
jgi:hypothetical protein